MVIKYLDKHGLGTLVAQIKKRTTQVYTVKGSAIYADADFVALPGADKEAIDTGASAINAVGLWQKDNGTYGQITDLAVGDVYDIINAFTTDANFREGAGKQVEEGMNIVAVNTGTEAVPEMKFDLLAGLLNLDKYQTKKLVNAAGIEVFDNTAFHTAFPSAAETVNETVITGLTGATFTGATAQADAEADVASKIYVAAICDEDGASTLEGDVFRCFAEAAESTSTPGDWEVTYTWVKLGNQTTVEGMLEFLGKVAPNTPITDDEIIALFNN